MKRVRVLAAILALLTAMIAGLLSLVPGIDITVVVCSAVGALCLAIIVPFDASEPAERKRVLAACVAFVAALAVAVAIAVMTDVDLAPLGALTGLTAGGAVLAVWSFNVRNRRRRTAWSDYYDR